MKFNPNDGGTARPGSCQGFTLVEMLLVLTILAILAGIVYPKLTKHQLTARNQAALVQIKSFDHTLEIFEMDNGRLPTGPKGLLDLVQKPAGMPNWHGPYLELIPKDPWGNDYVYVFPGKHRAASYDLFSAGADGQPGNADDINNWPAPEASR